VVIPRVVARKLPSFKGLGTWVRRNLLLNLPFWDSYQTKKSFLLWYELYNKFVVFYKRCVFFSLVVFNRLKNKYIKKCVRKIIFYSSLSCLVLQSISWGFCIL
jgi:hypothetical protein